MSISIEYFNDACHNVNRRTGGILMKIYKNLETGSVVEGLLMDVVPEYSDGTVDRAGLVPGMKPEYVFDSKGRTGKVTVYEYCNLHGLWKNEIEL